MQDAEDYISICLSRPEMKMIIFSLLADPYFLSARFAFLQFVSQDATAQLPPGGPAGQRTVWEAQGSLPGENAVERNGWCCQVKNPPLIVKLLTQR